MGWKYFTDDYLGTVLNQLGADSHFIDSQITLNNAISDATVNGIGALVDADLAKQSAKLQSLQIKQQLGTQSLGMPIRPPKASWPYLDSLNRIT
jgi:flagellin